MTPQIVEVDAEYKDMLDDLLRVATIGVVAFGMHSYVFNSPDSIDAAIKVLLVTRVGVGAYHLLVKSSLLKFVVKRGQENFYAHQQRNA